MRTFEQTYATQLCKQWRMVAKVSGSNCVDLGRFSSFIIPPIIEGHLRWKVQFTFNLKLTCRLNQMAKYYGSAVHLHFQYSSEQLNMRIKVLYSFTTKTQLFVALIILFILHVRCELLQSFWWIEFSMVIRKATSLKTALYLTTGKR